MNSTVIALLLVCCFLGFTSTFAQPKKQIAHGSVQKIDSIFMPQMARFRSIWVYLPPDYTTSTKKYRVLYLQDGQNLFEDSTSFAGAWHIGKTLDTLFAGGDAGCIVVGIENGREKRTDEYMPHVHPKHGGGSGDAYLDFIMFSLKPYVDSSFRTYLEPKYTAIGGSSLGGLISFYAALNYPNIFGKALIFSPSFWIDNNLYDTNNTFDANTNQRYYFLAGAREGVDEEVVKDTQKVVQNLNQNSNGAIQIKEKYAPDGQHSEWFWAREFGHAYTWLFADIQD